MIRDKARPAPQLLGQLRQLLGPEAALLHAQEREWASITFAGARHRFVFELPEPALTGGPMLTTLAALPEHEFRLGSAIVADCTATLGMPMPGDGAPGTRLLVIEVLTVDD